MCIYIFKDDINVYILVKKLVLINNKKLCIYRESLMLFEISDQL